MDAPHHTATPLQLSPTAGLGSDQQPPRGATRRHSDDLTELRDQHTKDEKLEPHGLLPSRGQRAAAVRMAGKQEPG